MHCAMYNREIQNGACYAYTVIGSVAICILKRVYIVAMMDRYPRTSVRMSKEAP